MPDSQFASLLSLAGLGSEHNEALMYEYVKGLFRPIALGSLYANGITYFKQT